jgi:hypothetical protein
MKGTTFKVNGKLLDSLQANPAAFEPFIEALIKTKQGHVANLILEKKAILKGNSNTSSISTSTSSEERWASSASHSPEMVVGTIRPVNDTEKTSGHRPVRLLGRGISSHHQWPMFRNLTVNLTVILTGIDQLSER